MTVLTASVRNTLPLVFLLLSIPNFAASSLVKGKDPSQDKRNGSIEMEEEESEVMLIKAIDDEDDDDLPSFKERQDRRLQRSIYNRSLKTKVASTGEFVLAGPTYQSSTTNVRGGAATAYYMMHGKGKKKKSSESGSSKSKGKGTCKSFVDDNTEILTSAGEICGADLSSGNYIIDVSGGYVDCGNDDGPTVSGDASPDCARTVLVGNSGATMKNGITLEDNSLVKNCVVRNFSGAGFSFTNTGGRKTLANSISEDVGGGGADIRGSGDNVLLNFESYDSFDQGVRIRPSAGPTTLTSPTLKGSGTAPGVTGARSGIRINSSTDTIVTNPDICDNTGKGIFHTGGGDLSITGGRLKDNDQQGVRVDDITSDVTTTITNVLLEGNVGQGIASAAPAGFTSTVLVTGSVIEDNDGGGISIGAQSIFTVSCSLIKENTSYGIRIDSAEDGTSIFDTSITESMIGGGASSGNNLFLSNTAASGIQLRRVELCDAEGDDIRDARASRFDSDDLSSTTCTATAGLGGAVMCGSSCDECNFATGFQRFCPSPYSH